MLVNSALARDATAGSFETQTIDAWQQSAAGDMVGLYAICKAFIGSMVAAGGGSIINISSIYGVVGNDPTLYEDTEMVQPPSYNFVKAGMINFTRYVANYYGKQGVRANCIAPGGYYTGQAAPFVERYSKRVPLGRMMDNEDLKGAVVFLASDASAYVTGHNLLVDAASRRSDGYGECSTMRRLSGPVSNSKRRFSFSASTATSSVTVQFPTRSQTTVGPPEHHRGQVRETQQKLVRGHSSRQVFEDIVHRDGGSREYTACPIAGLDR